MAATAVEGSLLELGCGTGRLLMPLARAGREVTGIDLAQSMLARCREKLAAESPEVRERVTLAASDMTSFDFSRRFAMVFCAFGSFHHLRTVEQQLDCLARCRDHLLPGGTLVLDLVNPDPSLGVERATESTVDDMSGGVVEWTSGRRVRSWATVVGNDRLLQCNDVEVTYEILEAHGATRRLTETFPMRLLFRYELEHLLARSGFRTLALYGDYDRSPFAEESLGMIVVAQRTEG